MMMDLSTPVSRPTFVGNKTAASCVILLAFCSVSIIQNSQNLTGCLGNIRSAEQNYASAALATSEDTTEKKTENEEQIIATNEQQTTHNRAPDFGIIGFPKTGTAFLLGTLGRHPEVVMPSKEFCQPNHWFEEMRNISSQHPQQTIDTPMRYGFKCPTMLRASKGVEDLVKIANQTRLVMGVRHPVRWFESFYNYRVQSWYGGKGKDKPIPSPLELTKADTHWRDVSVKYARFDIYMKQLAKVSLTDEEMKEMLDHDNMFPKRMSPNPYKIFMYTLEQMNDRTFQKDLQEFLQLRTPFPDFKKPKINRGNSTFNESIDICEEQYSIIRSQLIDQGKHASKWIVSKFMESPDVIVSDAEFFKSAIREWSKDPCVSE